MKPLQVDEPFLETVLSRVEIQADDPKKDAIVEAFKVIFIQPVILLLTDLNSTRGTRMVSSNFALDKNMWLTLVT